MKKIYLIFLVFVALPFQSYGMHIMEGFLPPGWSGAWWGLAVLAMVRSCVVLKKLLAKAPETKILIAMAAAFIFILSALKIPSVTGSSSHPTGTGFGTLLFGPGVMVILSFIVLLFQTFLLAHGGITTLGANTVSMGVAGPAAVFLFFCGLKKLKVNTKAAIFVSAMMGNMVTYLVTSLQLALAHSGTEGVGGAFVKFSAIFFVTQIPIAMSEGTLTVIIFNLLFQYAGEEIRLLKNYRLFQLET